MSGVVHPTSVPHSADVTLQRFNASPPTALSDLYSPGIVFHTFALCEGLAQWVPASPAPFYLERGSMDHLGRSIEKPFARAIAGICSSTIFYGMKDRAAQTKDELGRREII